jgi:hypothetical protein
MIVLSAQDLVELTDREKPSAQARQLDYMAIPYRRRRDGSLAVLRIHVETIEGRPSPATLAAAPEPELALDDL